MNDGGDLLTTREREVAALAIEGFSNKEIARRISVTEGTVKQHLHSAFTKLGIRGRMSLRDRMNLPADPTSRRIADA